MLVLTRKRRESVMIGDDIEVTVLAIDGSKVRIGIAAPPEMSVHRTELYLELSAADRGTGSLARRGRAG